MFVLYVNDMHQKRFARIVAVILLKEKLRKDQILVWSFWGVQATQNADLPREYNKVQLLGGVILSISHNVIVYGKLALVSSKNIKTIEKYYKFLKD